MTGETSGITWDSQTGPSGLLTLPEAVAASQTTSSHADERATSRPAVNAAYMAGPAGLLSWVFAAAPALLVACSAPHAVVACDDVGAASSIQIDYADPLRHHPAPVAVTACVNDVCSTQIVPSGTNRVSSVTLGGRTLHDAHPVAVSLVITDSSGGDVYRGDLAVPPHTVQANDGSHCPTAWVGHVVAKGQHTLREPPTE